MDVQAEVKRDVPTCGDNMDMLDMLDTDEEEQLAVCDSSASDSAFDAVIGCIEDIIMDDEFQQLQETFMENHYLEFDDSDENKLSYMPIFNQYVELLEKHLEQQLMERIPDFNMNAFIELLMQNKDDVSDDIVDMLLTFTDFVAFKEMFVNYRAMKEGRGLDLSQSVVVTSLTASDSKRSAELQ